jgi:hypothetical protein
VTPVTSDRGMTSRSATADAMPLTAQLLWLLQTIGRGGGWIRLDARTLAGIGHERTLVRTPVLALPDLVLKLLEERWGILFGPALREQGETLVVLAAAFATWPADGGSAPRPLESFPLPPSAVIEAAGGRAALWALEEPLRLVAPAEHARAVALEGRLAQALGADVAAAEDLGTLLPLPGSIVRNHGDPPPLVYFETLAAERAYSIGQLERALGDATAPPARAPKTAAVTRRTTERRE